jgi:hypothetical protein
MRGVGSITRTETAKLEQTRNDDDASEAHLGPSAMSAFAPLDFEKISLGELGISQLEKQPS